MSYEEGQRDDVAAEDKRSGKPCVLFDIDGTLANLDHRLHHVTGRNRNWPAFFEAMGDDLPIHPTIWLAKIIADDHLAQARIICVSGRPEDYRDKTESWLARIGLDVGPCCRVREVYMRPAGDTRPDHVVKRELLGRIRADGYQPFLVIDDRPSVVEMWRAEGLCCLQNAPHKDCAEPGSSVKDRAFSREKLDRVIADSSSEGAALGLLSFMSGLSEEHWRAGWLDGLEYSLWHIANAGPSRRFGMGELSDEDVALLKALHNKADGWWAWPENEDDFRFMATADWLEHLLGFEART